MLINYIITATGQPRLIFQILICLTAWNTIWPHLV
uniref:Uncharacterized protein n=1 Tax=Podoviridae sp. ct8Lf7 TaxID=2827723 RepID=A0A8S5S0J3_9CAUD|nr:MAG TPA: hypothetical protein [Podoviridae sp. ct8Lf7]